MKDLVQKTGAMAEKSVWVIDSKECRRTFREVGTQMFTKEFCSGQKGDKGAELVC